MRVPLSWLRDYVDIDLEPEDLAREMTFAGLEVEGMIYVGCKQPENSDKVEAKISGLEWDPKHFVIGEVREVDAHPNADRLVLVKVDDGKTVHTVVTGAPNLYEYKGQGALSSPLKVAFAKEGAKLYDGHKSGQVLTKLKRAKIRGVESSSMICSEKELGISEEHEGVIVFDADAPAAGTPLADYAGDVVFDIAITPNMSRNACILGVAREVAALTGKPLKPPELVSRTAGGAVAGKIRIDIRESRLNPRFTATLLEGVEIGPSPYRMQLRLRHAGMRPISNIVDVTNYVMLEIGQPLHAFDYDILVERAKAAGKDTPTIVTRLPEANEWLTTLDGVDRKLDDFTIVLADETSILSLGGIMGGAESEVSEATRNVLLEAAAWKMINVRRSVQAQQLQTSEAGYRFSRGVHPEQALRGNLRAIEMMRELAGGTITDGVVDEYPNPPDDVVVDFPLSEVPRYLGLDLPKDEVVRILEALEFAVEDRGERLSVTMPDHRVDIGTGVVGIADLVEEIARIYGYEKIGETQITDTIPPQHGNPSLELEEELRDLLARLGLQETITYRITSPEKERRIFEPSSASQDYTAEDAEYVELANPISVDRTVMRRSLLASVLEVAESNARFRDSLELFEISRVYLPRNGEDLPEEPSRLVIVMTGPREPESWQHTDTQPMDFYDLKGIVDELVAGAHLPEVRYEQAEHPSFHPGRTARLVSGKREIGVMGELHPKVRAGYELPERPVLAADFDLEALLAAVPERFETRSVSRFPAIREDLAVIVDEAVTSAAVEEVMSRAGGDRLSEVRLFDIFRGEQVGAGKKSLAYRLAFQSDEGTLTDKDAGKIRSKILKKLERELGAVLR